MSTQLHPYLNFDGRTEEAMRFYAQAIGGELTLMRMGDSPMPVPEEVKNRIMHAGLRLPGLTLMASDSRPGEPVVNGNSVHLSLNFDSPEAQDAAWNGLTEGATVTMPLAQQFFGRFGVLTDKFGMSCMLHYNKEG